MQIQPSPTGNSQLITKKTFWLEAYLAALHHLSAADALKEADEALRLCDERWNNAPYVGHWRYEHDFALGHSFNGIPPASRKSVSENEN
jgi:hypothetical protein